jgi:uncharacterized protein involved in oxidation of intracellular sulfur
LNVLLVLHDGPYGNEKAYNALRWAGSLARKEDVDVRVFLFGDSVSCAVAGQRVPNGYYCVENMIRTVARNEGEVGCCGTCMDARGITADMLTEGSRRSTLDEVTQWTLWADKVVSV